MNRLIKDEIDFDSINLIYQEILNAIDVPIIISNKQNLDLYIANNFALSFFPEDYLQNRVTQLNEVITIFDEASLELIKINKADNSNKDNLYFECNALLKILDKEPFPAEIKIHAMESSLEYSLFIFKDVSQDRHLLNRLQYHRNHDALTGLLKRDYFENAIQNVIQTHNIDVHPVLACHIKISHLKIINDQCGSVAGDELIRELTECIRILLKENEIFCRISGTEFGLIFVNSSIEEAQDKITDLLDQMLDFEFEWNDKPMPVSLNAGIYILKDKSENWMNVISFMDAACLSSQKESENSFKIFADDDNDVIAKHRQMGLVSTIIKALQNNRFQLFYQLIVPLKPSLPNTHIEILLRLRNDKGEIIPPNDFLPAAESYNLIFMIDKWVVKSTLKWLHQHPEILSKGIICNINLSGFSIGQRGFSEALKYSIRKYQIPPQQICFEITETVAIEDFNKASEFMNAMKSMGCKFALDDFGSGMSSFGYLKNLDADIMKIDGSLVKNIHRNKIDKVMVKSIHEIAHSMGLQTVAEYVENTDIVGCLKDIGVDYAQGFHFSKPQHIDNLVTELLN